MITLLVSSASFCQTTQKVYRVNLLNPAIEAEWPLAKNKTISVGAGIGYGGGYPQLTEADNGFIYIISPFVDTQIKHYYNIEKRSSKNLNTAYNSGNFVSARLLWRGSSIDDNVVRSSNNDFAFGPTWGIQRSYKKLHLLFDLGPYFYWDTQGNSGFFPLIFQLNIGFNLN